MEEYAMKLIESGIPVSFRDLLSLTLQEVSSVVRGFEANLRREKVYFGTVTAAIYNVNRKKGTRPLIWSDVFKDNKGTDKPSLYMSGDEMSAKLHALFGGA